jgi:hypothetical protein
MEMSQVVWTHAVKPITEEVFRKLAKNALQSFALEFLNSSFLEGRRFFSPRNVLTPDEKLAAVMQFATAFRELQAEMQDARSRADLGKP